MSEQDLDDELIRRYLSGDAAAFDSLYERHRKLVYLYAAKMLNGDTRTVDDVFQKIWLKVLDKLPEYRLEGRFKSWLMVLARNKIFDEYRSLRRHNEKFKSLDDEETFIEVESSNKVENDFQSEIWQLLLKSGEELSLEQREVLYARMEGESFKNIAQRQNVSINTVLARMQYAIKKIRKIFEGMDVYQ